MFPPFVELPEKEILAKRIHSLPDDSLSHLTTKVLPPGALRDVALKTLRRLSTPIVTTPPTLGGGGVEKKQQHESDVFVPLKPRDFPIYDPVYLKEEEWWRLHSGQYAYLVFPVPQESRRFILLCFQHEKHRISVLIDKWHGALRVTVVRLDRAPEAWFAGSVFHGFIKKNVMRLYNLAAYNDQSMSDQNSLYRFALLTTDAFKDYISAKPEAKSVAGSLSIQLSPTSRYPDLPPMQQDLEEWTPRAYWFVPDVDQVEVKMPIITDSNPSAAPTRTASRIKLTGRNPLMFEVPVNRNDFYVPVTFCIEPASHAPTITSALVKEMFPDAAEAAFHLKLFAKSSTAASSSGEVNYGTMIAHLPALKHSSAIIQHLQHKWIEQQVIHQLYCLETTDVKASRDHFGQLALKSKVSGSCIVFPDYDNGTWQVGVFSSEELDGLSLETVQEIMTDVVRGVYIEEARLRAANKNIDTIQRTDELDAEFLKIMPGIKRYILETTGVLQPTRTN